MGNRTKLQMRADLATDLKVTLDTELTTTEANRSIDRAYSDLSRFLPDEKIYEDSLQFAVTGDSVTFPEDTDLDGVVADEALTTSTDGDKATIDGQPDVPRPLTVTLTDPDDSIVGFTTIVTGIDKDDQALQEIFHFTLGDSKTIVGLKYFKAVYSVEFDQTDGNGASDVFDLGWGAYTDVWVYLANSPIKHGSESAAKITSGTAVTRNTDFYIDYANGRAKAIDGGDIPEAQICIFAYTKSQIGIDISDLPDLIRVQRVEYPVGEVPQTFVSNDVFGKYVFVTGTGESGEQARMAEDQQYRIYYDAKHQVAGEYSPGTEPSFLTDTVLLAAGAYALYILALKQEHQTATDIASARTALGNATGTHSALALALADVEKYLDNNNTTDAAGLLDDVNNDSEALLGFIEDALAAMNTALDLVPNEVTSANAVRAAYMTTTNYVDGGTEPDILAYLTAGDAILNTVPVGGEGQDVPRAYAEYARITREALVVTFENDRRFYLQNATIRTNAAMGYAQEAAQHLSHLRSFIERSAGYTAIANAFNVKAGHYLSQVMSYLQQASQYVVASNSDIALADRFRAEADERRNEVYSIWRDRRQYIGDFTAGSVRQMPQY